MAKAAAKAPIAPTKSESSFPSAAYAAGAEAWLSTRAASLTGLALVLLVTCVIYYPALSGGRLWDDDAHMTNRDLQSLAGLHRIWFDVVNHVPPFSAPGPPATQQYYPLLHSAFWVQTQLWGDSTFAHHAVNLALHLAAVSLAYFILFRLKIPGALLAAALFALHPVHVETVAWITEQKNTLSAVFYLGAMLAYLQFDENRRGSWYSLSLGLFLLGLLSKTTTATLPAALLVIFWWQRGRSSSAASPNDSPRLSLRRDVLPLLPFFAIGAFFGGLTAWVEWNLIGAQGEGFEISPVQRVLIAGRVIWFYLFKLLWPADLVFIYPRWQLDAAAAWQWLFPLAAIAMTVFLWAIRGVTRAPLAAWLLFVGTLFPVLGFLNVYPFLFSFVADHFQYLASLAVMVLVAAGVATGIRRLAPAGRWVARAGCLGVLGILTVLTSLQIPNYANSETLYRATIAQNPACWMAYNNLGGELVLRGNSQLAEARECFENALKINPDYPEALNNLGAAMLNAGDPEQAFEYCAKALRIRPTYGNAHTNVGNALEKLGRRREALEHLRLAVHLEPHDADANNSLGAVLLEDGHPDKAREHFQIAVRSKPNAAEIHNNLGVLLLGEGQVQQAIDRFKQAVQLRPDYPEAFCNLGDAQHKAGQNQQAIEAYRQAISVNPNYAAAHSHLGVSLYAAGQIPEATEQFAEAVRLTPENSEARNNLGALLSKQGRFPEAVEHLKAAIRLNADSPDAQFNLGNALNGLTRYQDAADHFLQAVRLRPDFADGWASLARSNSRLGRNSEAAAAARQALELAIRQGNAELAREVQSWFTPSNSAPQSPTNDAAAPSGSAPANLPAPALPPP